MSIIRKKSAFFKEDYKRQIFAEKGELNKLKKHIF